MSCQSNSAAYVKINTPHRLKGYALGYLIIAFC